MEIYKDLKNPASKEFEQLLNSQLSKTKIEEGKIIEGKINKITDKFVFLFIDGLKSEPVLDINELKSIKKRDNNDYNRRISPLKKTKDSILINTSNLTKSACFFKIKKIIEEKLKINGNI